MTTSPLKVEDGRAQFEAWAEEVGALPWGYLKKQRTPGGGYSVQIYNYMWSTWQASRAAIVVELPDYTGEIDDELSCFDGEYEWGNRAGASYAVTQCAGIIRAAGITVKGDS